MSNNTATVQITPNKKSGTLITPYASNAEYGFIQLQSVQLIVDGAWLRESKRSTLFRGKMSMLELWMKFNAKGTDVPGRICINEFMESQIPDDFKKEFNSSLTYEENITPLLKRAGENGPVLTKNGERIVRFSRYDATNASVDNFVKHDAINASAPQDHTVSQKQSFLKKVSDAADDIIAETSGGEKPF